MQELVLRQNSMRAVREHTLLILFQDLTSKIIFRTTSLQKAYGIVPQAKNKGYV